jgi:hypothetical protein
VPRCGPVSVNPAPSATVVPPVLSTRHAGNERRPATCHTPRPGTVIQRNHL